MLEFSRRWANWQTVKNLLIFVLVFTFCFCLYVWRLGTLVPGLSKHENAARIASGSYHKIIDNPINAPHKVVQYLLQLLDYHGAFWMRSVSVLFALVFLVSFYLLLKMWFGRFISLIGTLIFATTPIVIIVARSAAPDVMWFSSILFILAYTFFTRTEARAALGWFLFIISIIFCIYTPGLIWLVLLVALVRYKKIIASVLKLKKPLIIIGVGILLICLLPLFYAMLKNPSLIRQLLLIPASFIGVTALIKNIIWAFSGIVYQLPAHIDYALGRLAILDVAEAALAAIGLYALWKKAKSETIVLLVLIFISIIGASINSNMLLLGMSVPALIILAAAGLRHLYKRWFLVFPVNPFPRGFAAALVALLLVAQVAYGIRYAVFAWPHNVEIRKAYMVK
jgi:hypothetical protein